MEIKFKLKLLLAFMACIFYVCNAAYAEGVVSIPIQPKETKVKYIAPAFFSKNQPSITMMADDPEVVSQVKSAATFEKKSKRKGKSDSKRAGSWDINKQKPVDAFKVKKKAEVINFPINESSVKVTNSGVNFLFSDITSLGSNGTSNLLTLSLELRRLQVEAARQAAFKVKRR